MDLTYLPVNPSRTKNGAIAALADLYPEDAVMPVPLEAGDPAFRSFRVLSDNMSVSLAGKLNIGSIFGGSAGVDEMALYYDATSYTEKQASGTLDGKIIFATRWGAGLRVAIRVSIAKADFQLTVPSVAAAVQLQRARARYEIQGLGIGVDGLAIVLKNLPPLADFTLDTYNKLNGEVLRALGQYIVDNKASLTPEPIAIVLNKTLVRDPLLDAREILWTMKRIKERMTLADVLKRAATDIDSTLIRSVYAKIVGDIPETQPPSKDDAKEAEVWIAA